MLLWKWREPFLLPSPERWAALEKRVDLFGVIFLGATTALAGGIIRDVLIGKTPPAAFSNYRYMAIAVVTALVVFFIAWLSKEHYEHNVAVVNAVNNVFDAAGLGAFTITGAKVAMSMGYMDNGFFVVFLAMVTGIGGGVLRDLMIGEIPFVLRKRIYAVASHTGRHRLLSISALSNGRHGGSFCRHRNGLWTSDVGHSL